MFFRYSGPNSILPEAIKSTLTRQLLGGSIKPILPKPQKSNTNGSALLSSLVGSQSPQTLAAMLSAGPNGSNDGPSVTRDGIVVSNASLLGTSGALQATGYGPQGPTISVQQIIAAHRKDNPSSPPVRYALNSLFIQYNGTANSVLHYRCIFVEYYSYSISYE